VAHVSIDAEAPPDVVWRVLSDTTAYGKWVVLEQRNRVALGRLKALAEARAATEAT
jgi:hypothetical protein